MKLRYLLPFDHIKLRTNLNTAEVYARLDANIAPRKTVQFLLFSNETRPYEGEIIGSSFRIRRIVYYRNSFLPVIIGEISSGHNGTDVSIRMRPSIAYRVEARKSKKFLRTILDAEESN